jgi:diamine N-acetyltransferase
MLIGTKVILRAPGDDDLAALAALRNDAALQLLLMSQPRPNTPQRVRDWVAHLLADDTSVFFIIEVGGQAVGYLQIVSMRFLHGTGELGICLKNDVQGQGIAAEALALVETYAQEVFNLRKLTLQVLSSNTRAVRFYEKSGFRTVGVWQRHFYQRGSFRDVMLMEKFLGVEKK